MIDFVIWGCGFRGKMLVKCLDKNRIQAFIDSDDTLQGACYCGIPIISIQDYIEKYRNCFLIISPNLSPSIKNSIIKEIKKLRLDNYFLLERCPGELPYYENSLPFDEMLLGVDDLDKNKNILIVGINLFSLLLYEYMVDTGYRIFFYDCDVQYSMNLLIKKDKDYLFYPKENYLNNIDKILITDRFIDKTENLSLILKKSNTFYRFPWLKRYKYKNLRKFNNIHKGHRCFLVATGPSLTIEDLNKLHKENEISISVNMVYRCFDSTDWRPDYLVCTDTSALKIYKDDLLRADVKYKFIADRQYDLWKDFAQDDIVLFHSYYEYYEEEGIDFSSDINDGVYAGWSVMYTVLQIAVYMGFDNIYIIGADCEYKGDGISDEDHFISGYYESINGKVDKGKGELDVAKMFMDYQKALTYANAHGINLYNATRGGKLEVLPRVDFDSLF